eukprot:CAMPEP_0113522882 /NCGR_PEP_ID=MMETSP0014_2-20120614/45422_1 /TAXON_ID=2857 /ORGANISM="Nitzschia sp." /LENGTH=752 /DNA_ID=CAMNT_0000420961 /DNA_START=38 /DNA_END=2296 /DNA_ORIENTATION=+ /assembly_acc=CAM_ASM_000159
MSSTNGPDQSLMEGLTEEQKEEARRVAAAAARAEERAEQRALERAMERKRQERLMEKKKQEEEQEGAKKSRFLSTSSSSSMKAGGRLGQANGVGNGSSNISGGKIQFVSKLKRADQNSSSNGGGSSNNKDSEEKKKIESFTKKAPADKTASEQNGSRASASSSSLSAAATAKLTEREREAIRQTYLGSTADSEAKYQQQKQMMEKKKKKKRLGKKAIFRFEWDNTDDTLQADDYLYADAVPIQRRNDEPKYTAGTNHHHGRSSGNNDRKTKRRKASAASAAFAADINSKPLDQMTSRDWRIMRENYEIVVKGGRAPPPLRSFQDGNLLHPSLLKALIQVMRYSEPSPIQRQAIPIGLQRRDLIGIAETGSGKTAAFGIPLIQYILQLPAEITTQQHVADHGPLALVVAPTRELALQIHGELEKLVSFCPQIECCPIVGGQNLQQQSVRLRRGVHVVVGTPGRLNECLDMAYMVLNQCLYLVMDEGDRMIDMGFAPQLESILDAMGGTLKSENEHEAYQQEEEDRKNIQSSVRLPKHRLTAMFSATMPPEVEQMAKKYLRHPAVISVGDQDSGKNTRIVQRIIFLSSPSQKEKALRDLVLDRRFLHEKVIVFVNEKKHADGIGRMIERFGRRCVVLHGGKSQDQREENLAAFRQGGVVLVATDVAGRGLDIPNVAHVINYDLPTRSIDSYNHRIGRTGRAGKEGHATSLMTDEDQGIMAQMKSYLESTGNSVPDRLARHPAANSSSAEENLIY